MSAGDELRSDGDRGGTSQSAQADEEFEPIARRLGYQPARPNKPIKLTFCPFGSPFDTFWHSS